MMMMMMMTAQCAMHLSAKRGLAIACRPSVSVRSSVCDVGGL